MLDRREFLLLTGATVAATQVPTMVAAAQGGAAGGTGRPWSAGGTMHDGLDGWKTSRQL